jgi:hypothetical protein
MNLETALAETKKTVRSVNTSRLVGPPTRKVPKAEKYESNLPIKEYWVDYGNRKIQRSINGRIYSSLAALI